MQNTLIATIGGLIALVAWGASDWLAARSSRKFSALEVNFAIQVPGMFIMTAVLLIANQSFPSFEHVALIVSTAISFTVAYLFFIKALSTGSVGIIVPLSSTYPLVTLILTVLFLSTVFTGPQILSMVIIVTGTALLTFDRSKKNKPPRVLHGETLYALGAALMWGFGFFIINNVVSKESWQIVSGILAISMALIAIIILIFGDLRKSMGKISGITENKIGILAGVILTFGGIAFFIAADKSGNVLIPAVIASAAPLVASILSAAVDKERLNIIKRVGAVVVVAGIVLLNII